MAKTQQVIVFWITVDLGGWRPSRPAVESGCVYIGLKPVSCLKILPTKSNTWKRIRFGFVNCKDGGCGGMQSVAVVYVLDSDLELTPGSSLKITSSKVVESVKLVKMWQELKRQEVIVWLGYRAAAACNCRHFCMCFDSHAGLTPVSCLEITLAEILD